MYKLLVQTYDVLIPITRRLSSPFVRIINFLCDDCEAVIV